MHKNHQVRSDRTSQERSHTSSGSGTHSSSSRSGTHSSSSRSGTHSSSSRSGTHSSSSRSGTHSSSSRSGTHSSSSRSSAHSSSSRSGAHSSSSRSGAHSSSSRSGAHSSSSRSGAHSSSSRSASEYQDPATRNLIWGLIKKHQYQEALNKLNSMDHSQFRALAEARCYSEMKQYDNAIEALHLEGGDHHSKIVALARIYQDQKKHKESIDTLKGIPNWEKNDQALITLGHSYEQMGNYLQAIYTYLLIPQRKRNLQVLCSLAYAYQENKEFKKAIDTYKQIPHWNTNKLALLGIATTQRHAGAYKLSNETYKTIPGWPCKDKTILAGMANNYELLGNFDQALATYKQIPENLLDTATLLHLGCCYEKAGLFQKAVETMERIPQKNRTIKVKLCLANAHRKCGDDKHYEEAISICKSIDNWEEHEDVLYCLARIYQDQGDYQKSLTIMSTLRQNEKNLLGLGRLYQQMQKYIKALDAFEKGLTHYPENDIDFVLAKLHCLREMGQYQSALDFVYEGITDWKENTTVSIALALCYEDMGEFDTAIEIFKKLQKKDPDNREVLISLARSFDAMGQVNQAIQTYTSFPDWENDGFIPFGMMRAYGAAGLYEQCDKIYQDYLINSLNPKVHIALALLYAEQKMMNQAIDILNSISDRANNIDVTIALARRYQEMAQYDNSISILQSFPNWKQKKALLLQIAHVYEASGDFEKALASFRNIKNWEFDKNISCKVAYNHAQLGNTDTALSLYNQIIKEHPHYQEAYYQLGYFLIQEAHPDACSLIDTAIQKWPHSPRFTLLKFKGSFFQDENETYKTLYNITKTFPYFTPGYLALIYFHLFHEEIDKAQELKENCIIRFEKNNKLLKQINGLLLRDRFIVAWGKHYYEYDAVEQPHALALTPELDAVFAHLSTQQGDAYLVGSVIHALLEEKPLHIDQDIDLVVAMQKNQSFNAPDFVGSPYIPCLYTARLNNRSVDCFIVPDARSSDFTTYNALFRDFTIGSLYMDKKGNLLDPTGNGLMDFRNKILRTVTNPTHSFQEDPIRLLRAIHWMMKGFKPIPKLEAAMKHWVAPVNLDTNHLHAVIRKHLGSFTFNKDKQVAYIKLLQHYELYEKLFVGLKITGNDVLDCEQLLDHIKKPIVNAASNKRVLGHNALATVFEPGAQSHKTVESEKPICKRPKVSNSSSSMFHFKLKMRPNLEEGLSEESSMKKTKPNLSC